MDLVPCVGWGVRTQLLQTQWFCPRQPSALSVHWLNSHQIYCQRNKDACALYFRLTRSLIQTGFLVSRAARRGKSFTLSTDSMFFLKKRVLALFISLEPFLRIWVIFPRKSSSRIKQEVANAPPPQIVQPTAASPPPQKMSVTAHSLGVKVSYCQLCDAVGLCWF